MSPPPVSAVNSAGAAAGATHGYSTWTGSVLGGTVTATPSQPDDSGRATWTITLSKGGRSVSTQVTLPGQFSAKQLTSGSAAKSALERQLSPPRAAGGAVTAPRPRAEVIDHRTGAIKSQARHDQTQHQQQAHPNQGSEHVSALKNALAGYASGGLGATDLRQAMNEARVALANPTALGAESRRYLEDFYRQAQAKLQAADAQAQSKAQAQAQTRRQAAEAGDFTVRRLQVAIRYFDRGVDRAELNAALAQARNADKSGWTPAQQKGFKAYEAQAITRLWPKANPQLAPNERALARDGAAKAREQRGKQWDATLPTMAAVGAQAPDGRALQGDLVFIGRSRQWALKGTTQLYRMPASVQLQSQAVAYAKQQIKSGGWGQLRSLDPRHLGGADRGKQAAQYIKPLRQLLDIANAEISDGEKVWARLANTKYLLQRGGDQIYGDGFKRYDEARYMLDVFHRQVLGKHINADEGRSRVLELMAKYRQGHAKQIEGFGANAETGALPVTAAKLGAPTISAIIVGKKMKGSPVGAVLAGIFSFATRSAQDYGPWWVYNKSPWAGWYDPDIKAHAPEPTAQSNVRNLVLASGDAVLSTTFGKGPTAISAGKLSLGGKAITSAPRVMANTLGLSGVTAMPTALLGTAVDQQFDQAALSEQAKTTEADLAKWKQTSLEQQQQAFAAERTQWLQQQAVRFENDKQAGLQTLRTDLAAQKRAAMTQASTALASLPAGQRQAALGDYSQQLDQRIEQRIVQKAAEYEAQRAPARQRAEAAFGKQQLSKSAKFGKLLDAKAEAVNFQKRSALEQAQLNAPLALADQAWRQTVSIPVNYGVGLIAGFLPQAKGAAPVNKWTDKVSVQALPALADTAVQGLVVDGKLPDRQTLVQAAVNEAFELPFETGAARNSMNRARQEPNPPTKLPTTPASTSTVDATGRSRQQTKVSDPPATTTTPQPSVTLGVMPTLSAGQAENTTPTKPPYSNLPDTGVQPTLSAKPTIAPQALPTPAATPPATAESLPAVSGAQRPSIAPQQVVPEEVMDFLDLRYPGHGLGNNIADRGQQIAAWNNAPAKDARRDDNGNVIAAAVGMIDSRGRGSFDLLAVARGHGKPDLINSLVKSIEDQLAASGATTIRTLPAADSPSAEKALVRGYRRFGYTPEVNASGQPTGFYSKTLSRSVQSIRTKNTGADAEKNKPVPTQGAPSQAGQQGDATDTSTASRPASAASAASAAILAFDAKVKAARTALDDGQPVDVPVHAGPSAQRASSAADGAPRLDPNGALSHELFRQALEAAPASLYDARGFASQEQAFAAVSTVLDTYNRLQQPYNGGIELTAAIFSITEGRTTRFYSTLVHKASVARDKEGRLRTVEFEVPSDVEARMLNQREASSTASPAERLRVPLPPQAVVVAGVHSHPLADVVSPVAGPSLADVSSLLQRARLSASGLDTYYIVQRVQSPQGPVDVAMSLELKPAYWLARDTDALADGADKGVLDINDWVTLRYVPRPGDPPQSPVPLNVISRDKTSGSFRSHLLAHNVHDAAAESPLAPPIDWPVARSESQDAKPLPVLQGLGIELPFLERASRYAADALRLPHTLLRRYSPGGLRMDEPFTQMPTPQQSPDHAAYVQEVQSWHRSLLTTLDFLLKQQRGGTDLMMTDPASGERWSLRETVVGLRAELPRVQALGTDSAARPQTTPERQQRPRAASNPDLYRTVLNDTARPLTTALASLQPGSVRHTQMLQALGGVYTEFGRALREHAAANAPARSGNGEPAPFIGSPEHLRFEQHLDAVHRRFAAEIAAQPQGAALSGSDVNVMRQLESLASALGRGRFNARAFLDRVCPPRGDGTRPGLHLLGITGKGAPFAALLADQLHADGWGGVIRGQLDQLIPSPRSAGAAGRAHDFTSTLDVSQIAPGDTVLLVDAMFTGSSRLEAAVGALERMLGDKPVQIMFALPSPPATSIDLLTGDVPIWGLLRDPSSPLGSPNANWILQPGRGSQHQAPVDPLLPSAGLAAKPKAPRIDGDPQVVGPEPSAEKTSQQPETAPLATPAPAWFEPWRKRMAESATAMSMGSRDEIGFGLPKQLSPTEMRHWVMQRGADPGAEIEAFSKNKKSNSNYFFLGHDLHQFLGAQPDFLGETSPLTHALNQLKLASSLRNGRLPDISDGKSFFDSYASFITTRSNSFPSALFDGMRETVKAGGALGGEAMSALREGLHRKGLLHGMQAQQAFAALRSAMLEAQGRPLEQQRLLSDYESRLAAENTLTDEASREGYVRSLALRDHLAEQLAAKGGTANPNDLVIDFAAYKARLHAMEQQGRLPTTQQVRAWMDEAGVPYVRAAPAPVQGAGYTALVEAFNRPIAAAARGTFESRWQAIARRWAGVQQGLAGIDSAAQRNATSSAALDEVTALSLQQSHTATPTTANPRSQIAEANFVRAQRQVQQWVAQGAPLTVERLKQLNALVGDRLAPWNDPRRADEMDAAYGYFRHIGINLDQGGTREREFVQPSDIPHAMDELLAWYQRAAASDMPPIELAARLGERLMSIHPFYAGNGRTTLLAMDWILQSRGLPVAAFTSSPNLALFAPLGERNRAATAALADLTGAIETSLDIHERRLAQATRPEHSSADQQTLEESIDTASQRVPGSAFKTLSLFKDPATRLPNRLGQEFLMTFVDPASGKRRQMMKSDLELPAAQAALNAWGIAEPKVLEDGRVEAVDMGRLGELISNAAIAPNDASNVRVTTERVHPSRPGPQFTFGELWYATQRAQREFAVSHERSTTRWEVLMGTGRTERGWRTDVPLRSQLVLHFHPNGSPPGQTDIDGAQSGNLGGRNSLVITAAPEQSIDDAKTYVLGDVPGNPLHPGTRKTDATPVADADDAVEIGAASWRSDEPRGDEFDDDVPRQLKSSLPDAALRAGASLLSPELRRGLDGEPSRWALATPQQLSWPPDAKAPTGLRAGWARKVAEGVNTSAQARDVHLRELAAYYRSGVEPALANRRAFVDGLLQNSASAHHKPTTVAFIEMPGALKPINDHVGHVAADKLVAQVLSTAADVARQHPGVTVYQLDALRLAVEGSARDTQAFADAFEARVRGLQLSYVAKGTRYSNQHPNQPADGIRAGLPLVRASLDATAGGSRQELLFQGIDALDSAGERLKTPREQGGTGELDPERGAHLRLLKQESTDEADGLSVHDPGLDAASQPQGDERRALKLLSPAMRDALQAQTRRVIGNQPALLPAAQRAIEALVFKSFSTDEAFGRHLGNELAFNRAERERRTHGVPGFRNIRTVHGFIDVGAVGLTNREVSRFGGDAVLTAVHATAAEVARDINQRKGLTGGEAIEVFAVGGDEIRFISSEMKYVRLFAKEFARAMRGAGIKGVAGDTPEAAKRVLLTGIPVYVGVGETMEDAEAQSNTAKAKATENGHRVAGQLPRTYNVAPIKDNAPSKLEQELQRMAQAPVAQLLALRPALKQELLQLQRERGVQFELTSNNLKVFALGATEAEKGFVLDPRQADFLGLFADPLISDLAEQVMATAADVETLFKDALGRLRERFPAVNRAPAFLSGLMRLPEPQRSLLREALNVDSVHTWAKPLQNQGWSLSYRPAREPASNAGVLGGLMLRSPQGLLMPLLDEPSLNELQQMTEPNGDDLIRWLNRSLQPGLFSRRLESAVGSLQGLSAILAHRRLPLSLAVAFRPELGDRLRQLERDGWRITLNPEDGSNGRLGGLFVRRPDGLRLQLTRENRVSGHPYRRADGTVGANDDEGSSQRLASEYENLFSAQHLEAALQSSLGPLNGVDAIVAEPNSMIGKALREYPAVQQRLRHMERRGWQVHLDGMSGLLTPPSDKQMPSWWSSSSGQTAFHTLHKRLLVREATLRQVANAVDHHALRAFSASFGLWSAAKLIAEGVSGEASAHPYSQLIAADRELLQTLRAAQEQGFKFLGNGDLMALQSPRSSTVRILTPRLNERVWRAFAQTHTDGRSTAAHEPIGQDALRAELKVEMLGMLHEAGYALPSQAIEKAQQQVAATTLPRKALDAARARQGRLPQDTPWASALPLPSDIASADPRQIYRVDREALARLFTQGSNHAGTTWHLVSSDTVSKEPHYFRVTFDGSGAAAFQRLERSGWSAAAFHDQDWFMRLPSRLGDMFASIDPVPPAWSSWLHKIDPAALPRGNKPELISAALAFDRVLDNAWLHRAAVADAGFSWELLAPPGQTRRSFDAAQLQQQIDQLAEGVAGSSQQGLGWQEFRNAAHERDVIEFQVYASLEPDSVAAVARDLLDAAPTIGGLIGFKVARDAVKAALPANLMLYVSSQRGLQDVLATMQQIQSRHPDAFLKSSQAFAQEQVLPGVGYAQSLDLPRLFIARGLDLETPTRMRFALVQRALQEVVNQGGSEADFRARVNRLLTEHNINPGAPHLNLYARGARAIIAREQQRQTDAESALGAIADLQLMAGAGEEPAANRPILEVLQGTDYVEGGRLKDDAIAKLLRMQAALTTELGLQQGEVPLLTAALAAAAAHWAKGAAGDASKADRAGELKSQLNAALEALSPTPKALALKDDTDIRPGQAYAIELDSLPANTEQRFAPMATLLQALRSTNPFKQKEGVYRVELSGPDAAPARLEITVDGGGWITVQQELASEWMTLASDGHFNQLSVVNGTQGLQRIEDIGYTRYAIAKDEWPSELLSRQRAPGSSQTTNPIDSVVGGADAIAQALAPHLVAQGDLAAVSAALRARARPVTLAQAQAMFLASTQSRGLVVGVANDGQPTLLAMTVAANNTVNTRPLAGPTAPGNVNSNKAFAAWLVFPSPATGIRRTDPLTLVGPSLRDYWSDRKTPLAHGDANDSPVEAQRVADRLGLGRFEPRTRAAETIAATHRLSVAELEVLQLAVQKPQLAELQHLATQFVSAYGTLTASEKPRPGDTLDSRFAEADGLYAQATQSLLQKLGVDSIEAAVEVAWPEGRLEAAQATVAQQRERDQQAQHTQQAGSIQSIAGGGEEPAANRPILEALQGTDLLQAGRLKDDAWPRLFDAQRAVAREFGVRREDVSMHAAALKAAELFWAAQDDGRNDSAFTSARSAHSALERVVGVLTRLAEKPSPQSERAREHAEVKTVEPVAQLGMPRAQDDVPATVSRGDAPVVRPPRLPLGQAASITPDSAYELNYRSDKEMKALLGAALKTLPSQNIQIRTPDGTRRFDVYRHVGRGTTVIDQSTGNAMPLTRHKSLIRYVLDTLLGSSDDGAVVRAVAKSLDIGPRDRGVLVVSSGNARAVTDDQPHFYLTRDEIEHMLTQPADDMPPMTEQTVRAINNLVARGEIKVAPGVWNPEQHLPAKPRQMPVERAEVDFDALARSLLGSSAQDPLLAAYAAGHVLAARREAALHEQSQLATTLFLQLARDALVRLPDLDAARERHAHLVALAEALKVAKHADAKRVRAMATVVRERIQAEEATRLSNAPQGHATTADSTLAELARLLEGNEAAQLDAADRLVEKLIVDAAALREDPGADDAARTRADALATLAYERLRQSQADRARRAGDAQLMLSPRDEPSPSDALGPRAQSLRGADLSGTNMRGMSLRGADLRQANLSSANLIGMDLRTTNLSGANLISAGLSDAKLSAANLSGALLDWVHLDGATLDGANLTGVQMRRGALQGANLQGTDWSGADLYESNFSNANLSSARLNDAQLGFINFKGADLTGADIHGAEFYLPTMNLQSAKLQGLKADPRVLANLKSGAPPLQGLTLLKFYNGHTAKVATPSATALPTLERGGYIVVAAVPQGKGLQEAVLLMSPTSNALWNGGQTPPGAEEKPQGSHRVLAQNEVFAALSKDSVVLGATLLPEPSSTAAGSAPGYRLSTQSWSVNSLIDGYLGTRRIAPVVVDSSKPDVRPYDVYLEPEVSQPLAERLERDLGIRITHVDGQARRAST
jgi:uncharacterized protein YjbI with pentapeptide repeats/Fic family protein